MVPDQMPVLETERLALRPFAPTDAKRVQELAGERDVASRTLNIPYPYPDGAAEQWIATHAEAFRQGALLALGITPRSDGSLVGAISLASVNKTHARAELGYWVGRPCWNKGYCTEAARALIEYGFTHLNLNRIEATHLVWNPASGRVMQKLGMTREGLLRQYVSNRGTREDVIMYSILRREFEATERTV